MPGTEPNREEEIRQLAYRLWQEAGCPEGIEAQHWLKAEAIWLAWVIVGTSSTMMAVIGATENLGLIAAMRASGATARARTASNANSLACGTSTPMAPP